MVVSLNIVNYDVHHILVDNESSADILLYEIFSQMGILSERLGQMDSPLVVFIGDSIPIEGVITLTVIADHSP